MRAFLLSAILLLGCGSDTTASPPGNNTDSGTGSDTPGNETCFTDGWCREPALPLSYYSVWASASNDVWVLGSGREAHRFDGTSWKTSQIPGEGEAIAIFGRAANDVWVGLENGVKHFDGTNWTTETVTPPAGLYRFGVDEKGDVWARTYSSGIYRREGTAWVAKLPDKTLDPVVGSSITGCDSKLWVPAGSMVEWDGTTFWQHGVSSNDDLVRAAGSYGASNVWVSSRVLRRFIDGNFKANLLDGAPKGLSSMSVLSDTEAYALGEGPVLASFDGTKWTKHPTIDVSSGFSVFASAPGVVRVMSKNGSIVEYQVATAMRTILAYTAFGTIVGTNPAASWISAGETFYNENGSMWRWAEGSVNHSSRGTSHKDVRSIWAENSTSVWLTGGKILRHFTGGTTTIDVNTGIPLELDETYLAVAGSGPNDVWVLTNKRNLRFDGAWKAYPSGFTGNDLVAHAVIVATNDVWVFRGKGRFAHFDGTSFRAVPEEPNIGLAGCASGKELVAISSDPPRVHRGAPRALKPVADLDPNYNPVAAWFGADGTAWIAARETTGTSQISYFDGKTARVSVEKTMLGLDSIWALPSGEVWAVGAGGLLHRKP